MVEADGGYHDAPVSNARMNTVQAKEEAEDAEFSRILLRKGLVGYITVRIKSQGKEKKKKNSENEKKQTQKVP